MNFKKSYFILAFLVAQFTYSQEGVAVYSDYLSDNYYLKLKDCICCLKKKC